MYSFLNLSFSSLNLRKVNGGWKTYMGAGGGYSGGNTKIDNDRWCYGGGGGSFSADPKAKFDHKHVEFGYCKIKKVI